MKKFASIILAVILVMFINVNCYAAEQVLSDDTSFLTTYYDETSNISITDNDVLKEKLIDAFPHLEDEIENAATCKTNTRSVGNIVCRESKWISEDELLGIAFDENGGYSAYDWLIGEGSKTWIDGTSSSGTGYVNRYNATLMVSNSYYLYTATISPISYSIVNGGYDSFIDTGIATSPITLYSPAYSVQMTETATSPAYAHYKVSNVLILEQSTAYDFPIEIRISNNNVYVYLFSVLI